MKTTATVITEARKLLSKSAFSREDRYKFMSLIEMNAAISRDSGTPQGAMLLAEASKLLNKAYFTNEDRSKFSSLIEMHEALFVASGKTLRIDAQSDLTVRTLLARRSGDVKNGLPSTAELVERRDMSIGVDSAGGDFVPAQFIERFLAALQQYDGLFEAAQTVTTLNGQAMGFPLMDDITDPAMIAQELDEGAQSDATNPGLYGLVLDKCKSWRSGFWKVSYELIQDSGIDVVGALSSAAAVRFARGMGKKFVTTLLSSASSDVTTAGATAITGDEVLDLMNSVDSAYRQSLSCGFLMNDTTVNYLRKLKDDDHRYLLHIDDTGPRPKLFGKTIWISPSMPDILATNTAIAFGDLSRFIIRRVGGSFKLRVHPERFADYFQQGVQAIWQANGGLAKPGSTESPIKLLTQHS